MKYAVDPATQAQSEKLGYPMWYSHPKRCDDAQWYYREMRCDVLAVGWRDGEKKPCALMIKPEGADALIVENDGGIFPGVTYESA